MDPCAAMVVASQPTDGRRSEAPSQQMVNGTRRPANSWLTFTPLMTGDTVTNITIQNDGFFAPEVVPLWPETKATWKSHDLLSQPWLLVDGEQHWFNELCNRAELSSQECLRFAIYLGNGWLSAMNVEKRIAGVDNDSRSLLALCRFHDSPQITIAVDGFRVTCLKYRTKFAFRLDTDALRFIPGYLYAQALKFKASPPKRLGNKNVVWNKYETKWDVYLSTGAHLSSFSVNKSLPFEKFHAQKCSSHRMAVDLLNENEDRKKKLRYRSEAEMLKWQDGRINVPWELCSTRCKQMGSNVWEPAESTSTSNEAACN